MERNWLIRTTQNQILGPVAKAKVLEFLQKGALGLNDEVTSGNGYWFSLKEKELVEKYLYGDVPQGYNPISESISVLSKLDNPDKTTSFSTAPANKTQVLQAAASGVAIPDSSDLEFPDITVINSSASAQIATSKSTPSGEDVKLPNQDDLEFPDITIVAKEIKPHVIEEKKVVEVKPVQLEKVQTNAVAEGPIVYPEADDLDYPDLGMASEPAEEVNEVEVGLALDVENTPEIKVEEKPEPVVASTKAEKAKEIHPHEDKKLLHERKVKASVQATHKETAKVVPKEIPPRSMPEHLKKRNDNYLMYVLVILVLIILGLFFYYYSAILNKPLPV